MSIYIKKNIITVNDKKYEKLFNHEQGEKYRIIFSEDDYDYIEDEKTIKMLNKEYKILPRLRFALFLLAFACKIFIIQYILNNYIFEFLNIQKSITLLQSIFLLLLIKFSTGRLVPSRKFTKKMILDIKDLIN